MEALAFILLAILQVVLGSNYPGGRCGYPCNAHGRFVAAVPHGGYHSGRIQRCGDFRGQNVCPWYGAGCAPRAYGPMPRQVITMVPVESAHAPVAAGGCGGPAPAPAARFHVAPQGNPAGYCGRPTPVVPPRYFAAPAGPSRGYCAGPAPVADDRCQVAPVGPSACCCAAPARASGACAMPAARYFAPPMAHADPRAGYAAPSVPMAPGCGPSPRPCCYTGVGPGHYAGPNAPSGHGYPGCYCAKHYVVKIIQPVYDECICKVPMLQKIVRHQPVTTVRSIPVVARQVTAQRECYVRCIPASSDCQCCCQRQRGCCCQRCCCCQKESAVPQVCCRVRPIVREKVVQVPVKQQTYRPVVEQRVVAVPVKTCVRKDLVVQTVQKGYGPCECC